MQSADEKGEDMTRLVDCFEEHETQGDGPYRDVVTSCPYYEIAEGLLAALKAALPAIEYVVEDMPGFDGVPWDAVEVEVLAAIAQAEGETA